MSLHTMDQVGDTMVHYEGLDKPENCLHATVSTTTGLQLTSEDRANIANMARHPYLQATSTDPTRPRPAKVALTRNPKVHGIPPTAVHLRQIPRVTPLSCDLPHLAPTIEGPNSRCATRLYLSLSHRRPNLPRPINMVTYTRTQPSTR